MPYRILNWVLNRWVEIGTLVVVLILPIAMLLIIRDSKVMYIAIGVFWGWILFIYAWDRIRNRGPSEWEFREKLHHQWLENEEARYRNTMDYPEDWAERRVEVYRRANETCELCGLRLGEMRIWGHIPLGHVHHKVPLSKGGSNCLDNLELLRAFCHAELHHSPGLVMSGTPTGGKPKKIRRLIGDGEFKK